MPFLASVLFLGVGLLVGLKVLESPTFDQDQRGRAAQTPGGLGIRRYWREILIIAFLRMAEQAPFDLFITFVLAYGTAELGFSQSSLLDYTLSRHW